MRYILGWREKAAEHAEKQPKDAEPNQKLKHWKSVLATVLFIAAGLFHAFAPHRLALDWPSIAMIFGGILLIFVPIEEMGSVVESLEFEKTKILFRQVKNLDDSVP